MAGRDRRTRYQGVFARHRKACAVEVDGSCDCVPSYYGKVYDRATRGHISTKRFATVAAAKAARQKLIELMEAGELPSAAPTRLREAHTRFIDAAKEGRALNKHGRRYKRSAIKDIDECLRVHVITRLGSRRLTDVRRSDIQKLVDDLTPTLSGSRVRSIVNAIRSLYRWAQDRELVGHDPAALVRLPAMNATPRERVATPAEFAQLLASLPLDDALPYALAGYGMGRRGQIVRLRWRDVDLEIGAIEWGVDEDARKSRAARRVVPAVRPLKALLKRAYLERGKPDQGELVCPPLKQNQRGVLGTGSLATRARKAWGWERADSQSPWKRAHSGALVPIGLHECRHTAATWLDAAGVSPKVASVLMGHAIPETQPGAAPITLARYTHTLPNAMERARKQLDTFLSEADARESRGGGR
jgi:integrase